MDYLAYADGLARAQRRADEEERHRALLDTMVRAALVASNRYEEKILFEEYFPPPELPPGIAADDSELDMDYSGVDFSTPDESEMEILQRMLEDSSVTVSGMDGSPSPEPLPAPREIAPVDIEQDREWV